MIVVTYFRSSGRSGLLYKQITCAGPDISSGRLPSDHKNRLQILIVLTEVAVGLWSSRGVWQCDSVRVLPARDNWELRQPLQWAARLCAAADPPSVRVSLPARTARARQPVLCLDLKMRGREEGGGRRVEDGEGARSWSLIFFTTSSSYHWQSSFLRLLGEGRHAGFVILKKGPVWATNIKHQFCSFPCVCLWYSICPCCQVHCRYTVCVCKSLASCVQLKLQLFYLFC